VVLNNNLVTISLHRHLQKCDRNLISLFDTMLLKTPWSLIISWKKRFALYEASSHLCQARKCVILENQLTTTIMASFPLQSHGRAIMKTMLVSSQGLEGTGRGVLRPR